MPADDDRYRGQGGEFDPGQVAEDEAALGILGRGRSGHPDQVIGGCTGSASPDPATPPKAAREGPAPGGLLPDRGARVEVQERDDRGRALP